MKKKANSNICLYFEKDESGKCKYYGGRKDTLEACYHDCKKIKNKKTSKKKYQDILDSCITGVIIE